MNIFDNPPALIALLFFLAILPVFIVLGTPFLKIAIVLGIIRNAIGLQQIPPNLAMYGLGLILTGYIMAPVVFATGDALKANPPVYTSLFELKLDPSVQAPYRQFLERNASPDEVAFLIKMAKRRWPPQYAASADKDNIFILLPAFSLTQLDQAFKMGILIFMPFLAIDLIVSVLLLAMGMMMVSPLTIALPFKVLLFVVISGWDKTFIELVSSFK